MTQLFWVIIFLIMLQPVMKRRLLEASRQRMIARIERERGSRVILLVHRQETMGLLGFPLMRYIDLNSSEQILRAIRMTDPEMPIDLVVQTPGGIAVAALQIARAARARPGEVRVVVPHYALSGGTLLALAADEILMTPHAVLGPVDPQLGRHPAASVLRAVEAKSRDQLDDETLILADQARMAIRQTKEDVRDLVGHHLAPERAEDVAELLTGGHWTHDHPLDYATLRALGLRVTDEVPDAFLDLMGMYPEPTPRDSSVEFVPTERRRKDREG